MSTDLYRSTVSFEYGDEERRELMEKVWSVTPWMINCFTDSINSERERSMREWCRKNIGPEAWPIHCKAGNWQLGGATIHGWTWIGFTTEAQMQSFLGAFPDATEAGHD